MTRRGGQRAAESMNLSFDVCPSAVYKLIMMARTIPGSQTGAVRATLDFAIAYHMPHGGRWPRPARSIWSMLAKPDVLSTKLRCPPMALLGCFLWMLSIFPPVAQAQAEQAATTRPARVVIKLEQLPDPQHWWPALAFDQDSKLLSVAWTTWQTNADFSERLHYAIIDESGIVQCDSESNRNNELIEKFPRLAMKRFHAGLISDIQYTNKFLDDGRWDVAPDLSSCVLVRQTRDLRDVVELWRLKPVIEKRWRWTREEEFGAANCRLRYVTLRSKEVIAIDCGFRETVFLDAASATQIDTIRYA